MKVFTPNQFPTPQRLANGGPPQPPNDNGPHDHVNLGERLGNGLIRGAKSLLPGVAAGAAGAALGTAGFYTVTWGARTASMALEFPGFIAAAGVIGGTVAAVAEAATGDGTQARLSRAAVTGGAIGAVVGVVAQMMMWSHTF